MVLQVMRVGICAVVLAVGCQVPATTVVYPGGPVISSPSESPLLCPAGTRPGRETKPSPGTLKAAREWCQFPGGDRHGPYIDYDGRSTTREIGTYEQGKKVGTWTIISEHRPFTVESVDYVNGLREGPTWVITTCSERTKEFWSYNGCSEERIPVLEGEYKADEREGLWTLYVDGKVVLSAEFVDGQRNGEMVLNKVPYDGESVQIRRGRWQEDQPIGAWTEFGADGQVQGEGPYTLAGDLLEGRWPEDAGHIWNKYSANKYIAGLVKHGVWTEYSEGGGEESGPYVQGKRHGPFVSWHPGHELISEKRGYEDGELSGPYEMWAADGQLSAQGAYAAGKEDGDWKIFHSNGALAAAGRYQQGRKVGLWVEMSESGHVLSRDNYVDGIKQEE